MNPDDPALRKAKIRDLMAEQARKMPRVDHNGRPLAPPPPPPVLTAAPDTPPGPGSGDAGPQGDTVAPPSIAQQLAAAPNDVKMRAVLSAARADDAGLPGGYERALIHEMHQAGLSVR